MRGRIHTAAWAVVVLTSIAALFRFFHLDMRACGSTKRLASQPARLSLPSGADRHLGDSS